MAITRISLLLLRNLTSSPRGLSTVTETATPVTRREKERILRSRVSQADSKTSIADILNQWEKEGNRIRRADGVNLVNYFRKRKNFHTALQIYDWMLSSNLEINNADQAIRIDLLSKIKGLASAETYFNSLQLSEKNNKTYGALLSCFCKDRNYERALEIFEKMKALSQTSTLNYNYMLSLHSSMDQPEKVLSLVQEMEEKKIAADRYTYNLLINSYAALKDLDAIEEVLKKMKRNKVECDLVTSKTLATIYINSGLHDEAKVVLGHIEKMQNRPGEEGFNAFHTLIKLHSRMKNFSGVNEAWESLKSTFPTPSNTCYYVMLLALSELGKLESLEKLFREWEMGCAYYDIRLPNAMLEFYLSQDMIEEATALFENLLSRGIEPNLRTLNSFANLCMKNNQMDLALKHLEMGVVKARPQNHNLFPTDETIKLFLNYFEEKNDADRAEKFIQSMKKINRLDSTVYDSLLMNIRASDVGSQHLL